ncbi:hypothetical protein FDP41_006457 [Naegleria fowleri]|uniref:Elongin-C n=1 Tax=Naegleria fowleri TaxID=5763 RepID=A0A6A5BIY1_NAEFO|nr:uncharacterized protein FDP41_006987 [Naegleria fowleri]XP_044559138.1 uncharacterized protein FDP41_006457 [Naegleria fowleri]KAF0974004.1 hypothetical protein FDP41_006987 [Naegleria fowleri]KAF0974425.1 hypothetical protein FDP41_006457 [Naegleria fowleri]
MSSARKPSASKGGRSSKQFQRPEHCLTFDPSEVFKVISCDDFDFYIDKRCAVLCRKFKEVIAEGQSEIQVDFEANVIEQVIKYLYYKQRYDPESENRPEFQVELYTALDVMTASFQLGC